MAAPSLLSLASGMTADLYRAAIGPRGQNYYVDHFTRFDAQGRTSATWHWPAYWNTLNWLIYRKMWGWALAYVGALVGAALLVFGVGKLVFAYSNTTGLVLFLLFLGAAFVVPGLYANAWYYAHCNERINEVLRNTPEVRDACSVLSAESSDRRRWLALAGANLAVWAVLGSVVAAFVRTPAAPEMQLAGDTPVVKTALKAEPAAALGATPSAGAVTAANLATGLAPADPQGGPFQAVAATVPSTPQPLNSPAPTATADALPVLPEPQERGPAWGVTSPAKLETFVKPAEDVGVAAAEAPPETAPVRVPAASAVAELPVQAARAAAAKPDDAKAAEAPAGHTVATPKPAPAPHAKAPVQTDTKAATKAAKKSWYVQAGAFAEQANADRVLARLQEAGVSARAEQVPSRAGPLTRMLVGPLASKAEAERTVKRIKALGLAAVVRYE